MAGDWIKVEVVTPDKPEIWKMAELLDIDPDAVVGKLIRVWAWADQQTLNGNAPSVTKALLNRIAGVTGFTDAMLKVGWLNDEGGNLSLPNFDNHNGQTAKKRANSNKRVAKHRNVTPEALQKTEKCNAPSVTKSVTREEKRREEFKNTCAEESAQSSDGKKIIEAELQSCFEKFWSSGIRKVNRKKTDTLFRKILRSMPREQRRSFTSSLVDDVGKRLVSDQLGFAEMHPTTYLNGERWKDEIKNHSPQARHSHGKNTPSLAERTAADAKRLLAQCAPENLGNDFVDANDSSLRPPLGIERGADDAGPKAFHEFPILVSQNGETVL